MKKNLFLIIIFLLNINIALATELHVGQGQQYLTISAAYSVALDRDVIIIHPGTYYDNLFINVDVDIRGSTNNPVDVRVIANYQNHPPFTIQSETASNISNITIMNSYTGIGIYNANSTIKNCIIMNNSFAGVSSALSEVYIKECVLSNNGWYGIYLDEESPSRTSNIEYSLFFDNGFSAGPNIGAGIKIANGIISNCTIVDNKRGVSVSQQQYPPSINNSIVFNNMMQQLSGLITDVCYSNIDGGIQGNGNIDANPLFVDPSNDNYNLALESPCIDAGDSTSPFDPDGTVADMGCYYFHHDYDIHRFKKGIRWLSFPRLDRDINGEEDLPTVLSEITPFLGIRDIDVYFNTDEDPVLFFENSSWSEPYGASSNWLYKVDVKPYAERILTVDGEGLLADHILTGTVPTDQDGYCWLGYWLPYPQSMKDAFGDGTNNDFWQYVEKVKSEDWFYSPANNQRGDGMIPVATSPNYLRLEYGKGYMVKFNTAVQDFQWNNSLNINSPVKRTKSESFPYTEKPDYEAIDFVNIPSSITEIGVYQDDLCVGAVVIEDSIAQILVYPQETTRNATYLTFEFIEDRGGSRKITNYSVYNPASGIFEQNFIIPGNQEYSIVSLGNGSNTNDTPFTNNITLSLNYPNPFNPTTTIEYSLSEPVNKIDLSIFNLKGQKINTLYSGYSASGNFKYIWDGRDINGNPVSSGIYMYKLESGDTKVIKKMLLMK